jgi:hypothetical protein
MDELETSENKSELVEPQWSVISFEKCEAANLSYTDAMQKLADLTEQKVSGLCIVTDEAAGRIKP